jgi:hypothetical protein
VPRGCDSGRNLANSLGSCPVGVGYSYLPIK